MDSAFDFAVIGGGIAGASIAAHLSVHASVLLLEMEDQPGYHSTGRSAAIWVQAYGNGTVRALTRASGAFLFSPPPTFCSAALAKQRSGMVIALRGQEAALAAFMASIGPGEQYERPSVSEALALCPILRPDNLIGVVLNHTSADIDVHALHHGYLRMFKARNGEQKNAVKVLGLERSSHAWSVITTRETFHAKTIVNAAGAWAGEIATLAGAQDIGMRPLKRTACLIDPPFGAQSASWSMIIDVEETFYLKPDAGMLVLSPADETPAEPCDAQADDIDVAIAVDRLERATTMIVTRVAHKWAGLRSFVRDRSPVVGYDCIQPGLFWLAALGGYGIQTAPALSRLAAALALHLPPGEDLLESGVDIEALSPKRLLR